MLKLFMPYALYERDQVVSNLLRGRSVRTLLDVGRNLNVLTAPDTKPVRPCDRANRFYRDAEKQGAR